MKPLTYATVCSGVECMSVASIGLPLVPVFFSEIEPFPCAVLKYNYPHVPNLGDMSRVKINIEEGTITNGRTTVAFPRDGLDILAGGTPCQDVSVAGLRRGMREGSGTRSSLAFDFVRLARESRARFVLWENVAGVLSDPSFPGFLEALGECGYSVAYRTLDAQWVRVSDYKDAGVDSMERAVPQRRRRVWVVGCLGADDLAAASVLFEHEGVLGDHPPRRRTRQEARPAPGHGAPVHDRVVGLDVYNKQLTGGNKCLNSVRSDSDHTPCVVENKRTWWDGVDACGTLTCSNARGGQRMPDKGNLGVIVESHLLREPCSGLSGEGHARHLPAAERQGGNGGGNLPIVTVERSHGINPQSSLMYPIEDECSQTLAVGHGGGVVIDRMGSTP